MSDEDTGCADDDIWRDVPTEALRKAANAMTDTPTPTDEEIAALCERLSWRDGESMDGQPRLAPRDEDAFAAIAVIEALQADLAKSRSVVMSLTQRLADAQAERDALQMHYDAASKAVGKSEFSSRPLSAYIKDIKAANARLAEHVKSLRAELEFYADEGRYDYDNDCVFIVPRGRSREFRNNYDKDVLADGGKRARDALATTALGADDG